MCTLGCRCTLVEVYSRYLSSVLICGSFWRFLAANFEISKEYCHVVVVRGRSSKVEKKFRQRVVTVETEVWQLINFDKRGQGIQLIKVSV